MNQVIKFIVYALMIVVGLVAMYSILNAGRPDSLLRYYLQDPASDVYVALLSSLIVFVLGFVVFYGRDRAGFRQIIEMNGAKIKSLRKQGKTDAEIADSILEALGSQAGYRHRMAKRKLVAYLADFI